MSLGAGHQVSALSRGRAVEALDFLEAAQAAQALLVEE